MRLKTRLVDWQVNNKMVKTKKKKKNEKKNKKKQECENMKKRKKNSGIYKNDQTRGRNI